MAAVATVAVVLGFVAWIELQVGGERATIAVDDIGEAVAAFAAALCCGWAAMRNGGRQRIGWGLLAASAATWAAGEVVWSVYEVGLGVEVPFPSAADAGFLGAIPLAAVGILAFFTTPRGTSTRFRLWLDGAIVFTALLFVGWVAGLDVVYEAPDTSALDRAIQMAYPISDILIGTIVVLAIRRATGEAQGRLLLLLGGLGANALADSAFAYLNAQGAYGPIGSVLDAGWVAGYLMIGLAAFWPGSVKRRAVDDTPIDVWQLALPWVAILAAGLIVTNSPHPCNVGGGQPGLYAQRIAAAADKESQGCRNPQRHHPLRTAGRGSNRIGHDNPSGEPTIRRPASPPRCRSHRCAVDLLPATGRGGSRRR